MSTEYVVPKRQTWDKIVSTFSRYEVEKDKIFDRGGNIDIRIGRIVSKKQESCTGSGNFYFPVQEVAVSFVRFKKSSQTQPCRENRDYLEERDTKFSGEPNIHTAYNISGRIVNVGDYVVCIKYKSYDVKEQGDWFVIGVTGHYVKRTFLEDVVYNCDTQCLQKTYREYWIPEEWIDLGTTMRVTCCSESSSSSSHSSISSSSSEESCQCEWPDYDYCNQIGQTLYTGCVNSNLENCYGLCLFSATSSGWAYVLTQDFEGNTITTCNPKESPSYSSCSSSSSSISSRSSSSISSISLSSTSSVDCSCYCCPPETANLGTKILGDIIVNAVSHCIGDDYGCDGVCYWYVDEYWGFSYQVFGDCGTHEDCCKKSSSSSSSSSISSYSESSVSSISSISISSSSESSGELIECNCPELIVGRDVEDRLNIRELRGRSNYPDSIIMKVVKFCEGYNCEETDTCEYEVVYDFVIASLYYILSQITLVRSNCGKGSSSSSSSSSSSISLSSQSSSSSSSSSISSSISSSSSSSSSISSSPAVCVELQCTVWCDFYPEHGWVYEPYFDNCGMVGGYDCACPPTFFALSPEEVCQGQQGPRVFNCVHY